MAVAEQLGAARQEAQTEAQHLRAQVGQIVYCSTTYTLEGGKKQLCGAVEMMECSVA